jgi:MYXO-CTERM domain-containing protein
MGVMGWTRLAGLGASAIVLGFPITASAERVVYINLEPTTLINTAGEDPTMNSHNTSGFTPGPISGWPELTEEQRAELLYVLREASVPFDITFTFDRPAAGGYDMVVTGTADDNAALFDLGCSAAIGLADCTDTNGDNISFVFYGCMSAAQQADMRRVAFNALIALGFGWGLENLTGSGQVMGGYSVFGIEFGDQCTPISGTSQCMHVGCPMAQQNSTADLLDVIGARVDDGPPVVTILSPENLAVVEGGTSVLIDAEITDKFGGLSATLEVVEAMVVQDKEDPPFSWTIDLPPGEATWTLRVSGTDADGNVTTEEVVVCVDVEQCDVGPGTSGGDTGTGGDGTTTGEDTGFVTDIFPEESEGGEGSEGVDGTGPIDPSAPIDPSFDLGPAQSGCHCSSGDEGRWSSALLLLGLLGLRRRRVG